MKNILVLLMLMITACSGGDESNSTTLPEYPSSWIFPYTDRVEFQRHNNGDVIGLSDKSLWYITGMRRSFQDALYHYTVTINENNNDFGAPNSGVEGPYYMHLEGATVSFYIEPIHGLSIISSDVLEFQRETTGSLLALTDGSLWDVVGTHSSGQDVLHTHNIVIYSNTDMIPPLSISGIKSDYFMNISGQSRGFYLNPLDEVVVSIQDTVTFSRETTGDTVSLSDGSLWYITGTHSFGQDVLDTHNVSIYTNVTSISDPHGGERSGYYMYIYGASRGFFVEPL